MFGPIGEEVYRRTYARTKPDGTLETWPETVHRCVMGNVALGPVRPTTQEVYRTIELITEMKMIPAGRHLWVSGVEGRQYLFNCHRAGWTERWSDHFCFVFDELMKGGGIGSNYSNCYLEGMTRIRRAPVDIKVWAGPEHPDFNDIRVDATNHEMVYGNAFHVPDTREGWVSALRLLINAHQFGATDSIVFNVHKVRGRGEPIRGFGGTASGPAPLATMLRAVNAKLNSIHGQMTSLDAMELDHLISECVIAGNVRRSARMSIKHWADPDIMEFINCKRDNTMLHWTTNISVEVDDDYFRLEPPSLRAAITAAQYTNGEPGLFNSSLASVGESGRDVRCTNPCGEIALQAWENCNLGHINLARIEEDEIEEALELMTKFLIRATFSDITHPFQKMVVEANRRIGVGIFGYQEWVIKRFGLRYSESCHVDVEEALNWMRTFVDYFAAGYADELGIPVPVKTTTVAPTGTIAKMPGNTEGIHPVYAKHFIRRVRYSADDPRLAELPNHVPVEDDIYSAGTKVASFYCEDEIFNSVPAGLHYLVESANEIGIRDMLAVQAMVQRAWANNAISYTVNFDPERLSVEDMADAVFDALPFVKGMTVMPDGSRPQAPYQRITEDEYRSHISDGFDGSFDECATGACPIK